MKMPKNHKEIDWEYLTEELAWDFTIKNYNKHGYLITKDMCEEEVMYYMENDDDTIIALKRRIRVRIKERIYHLPTYSEDYRRFHDSFDKDGHWLLLGGFRRVGEWRKAYI